MRRRRHLCSESRQAASHIFHLAPARLRGGLLSQPVVPRRKAGRAYSESSGPRHGRTDSLGVRSRQTGPAGTRALLCRGGRRIPGGVSHRLAARRYEYLAHMCMRASARIQSTSFMRSSACIRTAPGHDIAYQSIGVAEATAHDDGSVSLSRRPGQRPGGRGPPTRSGGGPTGGARGWLPDCQNSRRGKTGTERGNEWPSRGCHGTVHRAE